MPRTNCSFDPSPFCGTSAVELGVPRSEKKETYYERCVLYTYLIGYPPTTKSSSRSLLSRHAEARRRYQVIYNKARRVTRRKLGKQELLQLRKNKRDELEGKIM